MIPGSNAPILLRPATRRDLPRIAEIRRGVRENRLSDPSKVAESEVLWYLDHAIFLVSEETGLSDETVQGFLCANHQTGFIWALFVDPAAEGRRHGATLLSAALERLQAVGHRQVHLTTRTGTRALGFYLRRGFVDRGEAFDGNRALVRQLDTVDGSTPST